MSRAIAISIGCGLVALVGGCAGQAPPPPAAPAAELPASVVQYALEQTPSGEMVSWRVAETGEHGTLTPLRTFRGSAGFCREYAATVIRPVGDGGAWQGTACRDPTGSWRASPAGA